VSASDTPTEPPPAREPTEPDPDDERYAIESAWKEILKIPRTDRGEPIQSDSLVGVMFSALALPAGQPEESPAIGILYAIRGTVDGWAHAHSESTVYAPVSCCDLFLMMRRIDVVIALIRSEATAEGEP